MQLMVGVPKVTGILATKLDKSQDCQGYLVFIIALNSVYLNPDDNIAKRSHVGITQPYAGDLCP